MAEYLSPWEAAAYQTRHDQASTGYQTALARLKYRRGVLGAQNTRNRDRLGQMYDAQRQRIPTAFVGRGLLNSGIYKQALEDYGKARAQGFGDMEFDYTTALGEIGLEEGGATSNYNTTLAGIAQEREARRAQLATQYREIA